MDNLSNPGLSIEQSARCLGALRWVELSLHRVLGGWVQEASVPQRRLQFAEWSEHHGWHAELLEARIPNVGDVNADTQTSPSVGAQAFVDAVELELANQGDDVRAAVYVRWVLPTLLESYDSCRSAMSSMADAPALRSFRWIVEDLTADLLAGTLEILRSLGDANEISQVGVVGTRLEIIRHNVGVLVPQE